MNRKKLNLNYDDQEKDIEKKSGKDEFWDIIKFTIIALLIVIPIRMFIAQPFLVSGESMVPTFQNGDYLIVDQISYRTHKPERGDVIVFRYPNNPKRFFIKRIIGLPNETILINGNKVEIIKTDGEKIILEEDYIKENFSDYREKKLEDGEYFVMGDNRMASSDSRTWGSLDEKYIQGRAIVRIFPISGIGIKPGGINMEEFEIPLEEIN